MTARKGVDTNFSACHDHHISLYPLDVVERAQAIGANILRHRVAAGLSQRALGKKAGLHYNTIMNAEGGKGITVDTLERIAAALGISFDALTMLPVQTSPSSHIVDRFKASEWWAIASVTEAEEQWLRAAPLVEWVGSEPTDKAIYLALLAQRERTRQ